MDAAVAVGSVVVGVPVPVGSGSAASTTTAALPSVVDAGLPLDRGEAIATGSPGKSPTAAALLGVSRGVDAPSGAEPIAVTRRSAVSPQLINSESAAPGFTGRDLPEETNTRAETMATNPMPMTPERTAQVTRFADRIYLAKREVCLAAIGQIKQRLPSASSTWRGENPRGEAVRLC